MANKFYIKRTESGMVVDLNHYEGITNIVRNQIYDIAVSEANIYGKIIPEDFIVNELRKLKEKGELKLVKGSKGIIKIDL